jgi:hypothetical protein
MRLPLSRALSLGVQHAHPDPDQSRPMLLALKGQGVLPYDLWDPFAHDPAIHLNVGQATAYSGEALCRIHGWLNDSVLCPWCTTLIKGGEIVAHPVEEHYDEIGYGDTCEWISDMEEQPDLRTLALAVYFESRVERLAVLRMARHQHLSSHRFLAAAARLVLKYELRLENFVEVV